MICPQNRTAVLQGLTTHYFSTAGDRRNQYPLYRPKPIHHVYSGLFTYLPGSIIFGPHYNTMIPWKSVRSVLFFDCLCCPDGWVFCCFVFMDALSPVSLLCRRCHCAFFFFSMAVTKIRYIYT